MRILAANYIADCQLKWATQEKLLEDYPNGLKGYTKTVEDNIFNKGLHLETKKEYKNGKRAHMKALHSSSALVVNVFDYWRHQNRIQDIAWCCGAESIINGMEFEKIHPIKVVGRTPPHLDVEFNGAIPLAIESKFTETYHRKTRRDNEDTHLNIYLEHRDIWNGIPKVRALAESIVQQSAARTDFEYIDVPQLIKHILGLRCSYRGQFSLLYIWYKINSNEAKQHEQELARFYINIRDEISFQIITYQDLFNKIRHLPEVNSAYLKYLERRYFSVS